MRVATERLHASLLISLPTTSRTAPRSPHWLRNRQCFMWGREAGRSPGIPESMSDAVSPRHLPRVVARGSNFMQLWRIGKRARGARLYNIRALALFYKGSIDLRLSEALASGSERLWGKAIELKRLVNVSRAGSAGKRAIWSRLP